MYQMKESQLAVLVLVGGELPFVDMEALQSGDRKDEVYYYVYATETEWIRMVDVVQ